MFLCGYSRDTDKSSRIAFYRGRRSNCVNDNPDSIFGDYSTLEQREKQLNGEFTRKELLHTNPCNILFNNVIAAKLDST